MMNKNCILKIASTEKRVVTSCSQEVSCVVCAKIPLLRMATECSTPGTCLTDRWMVFEEIQELT